MYEEKKQSNSNKNSLISTILSYRANLVNVTVRVRPTWEYAGQWILIKVNNQIDISTKPQNAFNPSP